MSSAKQRRVNNPFGPDAGKHIVIQKPDLAPVEGLGPVTAYVCRRTDMPIVIDGKLDEDVWNRAAWSEPFGDIAGGPATLHTSIALLWDDQYLYAGYKVQDPDVRGTMGGYHDHVYVQDDDVELFFAGDRYYYEIGLNPINNRYQLKWAWVEPLVQSQSFDELEHWLSRDDFIYYKRRKGESLGRIGDMNYTLPGLTTAVHIDGVLNNPNIRDNGWTVEMALPWAGIADAVGDGFAPPEPGDVRRMVAYRAHHDRDTSATAVHQDRAKTWEQQTWSVMGNSNIHNPERWTEVTFSSDVV